MDFLRNYKIKVYGPEMINVLSRPVEMTDFDRLIRLRDYMIEVMRRWNGVGLAAPQIGLFKQMVIFQWQGKITSLVNPEITRAYGKEVEDMESCLSLPPAGNECPVPRMETIEVESSTAESPHIRKKFTFRRTEARIVQHEIDHLTGTFFIDRVSERRRRDVLQEFSNWRSKRVAQMRKEIGGKQYVDAGVVAAYRGQSRLS